MADIFHPQQTTFDHLDEPSRAVVRGLVDWFEAKGKTALKHDDHERVFYTDFIAAQAELGLFAKFLTPSAYSDDPDARWDTTRIDAVNEVLGFYGLAYWYTWQVSILGLGPIWMSDNEAAKHRAAEHLRNGEVFAFGLSEKAHGADIYSTDMLLTADDDGTLRADGEKYYIGNANVARMVSTFGKRTDDDTYVFFAADSAADSYECIRNVINSQSYVANYRLTDHPVADEDILHTGDDAWNAALNTVNVGKFNLGWASIGIATHAFYEAITHAANRELYGKMVTDFPHVKRLMTDAYARLAAMRLFAHRAEDYMRAASAEDRRYLLYNPLVKMQVSLEGEKVINDLWDVIAAKGFENETYFEMAARDIRALPKLEGTVHVNIALALKFLPAYLFNPQPQPAVVRDTTPRDDAFLFDQGPARGLSRITFHSFADELASWDLPNVAVFTEQVEAFRQLLMAAPASTEQFEDLDLMMTLGSLFSLVPYAHLVLEQARATDVSPDLVDQIFSFLVRDLSGLAVQLNGREGATAEQAEGALALVRRPASDDDRYDRVWKRVHGQSGAYAMPL
nr:acyl-CoA dehydrogenase [Euzebya rosea]